jgi:hypothetical protein
LEKNINKGEAYQLVLSNLKSSATSKDIFHLIGLIATSESIMSDRLSAYLGGTKNDKYLETKKLRNYVPFGKMLEFSKKGLNVELIIKPKTISEISTKNLYLELKHWNSLRNKVIHYVCKSNRTLSHVGLESIFAEAQNCCVDAHRLIRLLLKWSSKTKSEYKNSRKINKL